MRNISVAVVFFVFIGGLSLLMLQSPETPEESFAPKPVVKTADMLLSEAGYALAELTVPDHRPDILAYQTFTAEEVAAFPLYLKRSSHDVTCVVGPGASLPDGIAVTAATRSCTVVSTKAGTQVRVDGNAVIDNLAGWTLYRLVPPNGTPPESTTIVTVPAAVANDGFMRSDLIDDNWSITAGNWRMKKHGGGMPETEKQEESYNVQRAVNPFSVVGEGVLTYGPGSALEKRGSACFYFGVPWKIGAVDRQTLPKASMYMAIGSWQDRVVGFGWNHHSQTFTLVEWSDIEATPSVLVEYDGKRPPVTNWVKLGIQIRNGHVLEGVMDGVVVLKHTLDTVVDGPFHIVGEGAKLEFDDFTVTTTVDGGGRKPSPIYVRSRTFAGKKEKDNSDPDEFGEWAKGETAFNKQIVWTEDKKYRKAVIMSRWPMLGDFTYESVPFSDQAGDLPAGVYEIEVMTHSSTDLPRYDAMTSVFKKKLIFDEGKWGSADSGDSPVNGQTSLSIRRQASSGNVIELNVGDSFSPVSDRIDGPVYIAIGRFLPTAARIIYPKPEHHSILSGQLVHEFFEDAPDEWSWIDGAFRMDSRWACQNKWNFMACGSTDTPMMVSKRRFSADQEHEYFITLRPMLPSDAGDPAFVYNDALHRRHLRTYGGWYNRHDLNVSFCMDGRNPFSGYSLIFGGKNNTETSLLRKGTVLAVNKELLFPKESPHRAVHWLWWKFSFRKVGNRIMILHKNRVLFDVTDPEPLDGGHVAFWSVRNGFIVSKVSSTAQTISWKPDVLYVDNDEPSEWRPLLRDSVHLTKTADDLTEVALNAGGGSMGVRYDLRPPILLKRTPVMTLPLHVPSGTQVNLHVQIDKKAYVIQVTAPMAGCKALLAPEFEPSYNMFASNYPEIAKELHRSELFQIPVIPEKSMISTRRLATVDGSGLVRVDLMSALKEIDPDAIGIVRSITVGNSSNAGYLMAGRDGNQAGATYSVGTPEFHPASD